MMQGSGCWMNQGSGCSSRGTWFGDDAGFRMLDKSGFRMLDKSGFRLQQGVGVVSSHTGSVHPAVKLVGARESVRLPIPPRG